MILVDTSAWIDFFNLGSKSPYGKIIENWLYDEEDLCLSEIILTEILQGIVSDSVYRRVRNFLLDFPIFTPKNTESYVSAGDIYRTCRKKGITLGSTIDCLIAQVAMENNFELFHKDRDFELISKYFSLHCIRIRDDQL